ncbi:MAG: 16S rRNA (guanine(966)-N(2))-methyltransferase RsmD [Clostridia bacterium]|nr:16S rRNA (guanine(966)-N(2))-methyltransferase RsmD [Clostridia bacterium]
MRIVSGKYRGMNLVEFKGNEIRPTADRVKENLFNILRNVINFSTALDLFCGSGNLGIECLSRGASYVHFNDLSKDSLKVLNQNLKKLKGGENYTVSNCDYLNCLSTINKKFDLILIDPPYKFDYVNSALTAIKKYQVLNANGIIVYEWDERYLGEVEGFKKIGERRYGRVYLTFFRLSEE